MASDPIPIYAACSVMDGNQRVAAVSQLNDGPNVHISKCHLEVSMTWPDKSEWTSFIVSDSPDLTRFDSSLPQYFPSSFNYSISLLLLSLKDSITHYNTL